MNTLTSTENPQVAKKPAKPTTIPPEPPFERIEFQARAGFTERLDAARKRRGLSRSAYIRQAVLLQIELDENAADD